MEHIYYNNYDCEKMGLDYEAYKEFCEMNEIEPKTDNSEDFYEWQRDECDVEWENVEYEIKAYDKKHDGHYYVDARIGRWNGIVDAFDVFDSLEKAIYACISNMDYVIIESKGDIIEVTAIHHDGSNHFEISKMSDEGYEAYDNWLWQPVQDEFVYKDEYKEAI